jgi:hypothetical protein
LFIGVSRKPQNPGKETHNQKTKCLKFEMKLLVDIPMVFGLVMLDMDAHMFMLTSLDFLGLNMMVLDVNTCG